MLVYNPAVYWNGRKKIVYAVKITPLNKPAPRMGDYSVSVKSTSIRTCLLEDEKMNASEIYLKNMY